MKRALWILFALTAAACGSSNKAPPAAAVDEVRLITLDPGHFHAALVQKIMLPNVSPAVRVYAPDGPELQDHLNRIAGFNARPKDPTRWREDVYKGSDFLERMIRDKKGNVVVISGNNRRKAQYIKAAVDAGLNVLADKPMCIDEAGFVLLMEAFAAAKKNGVLLYDIMTERSEITTILQRELMAFPAVFGTLAPGTPQEPAIEMSSVHHFFKSVAGNPLIRPAWFFDVAQQGEGLADVAVHLVDLVFWECFPIQGIDARRDIELVSAERWPTILTRDEFRSVTGLEEYPEYVRKDVRDGALRVYSNGRADFRLKGIPSRVTVVWNFKAPEGGGDTHSSLIRGTKAHLIIEQGKEQKYRPELYVQAAPLVDPKDLTARLAAAKPFLQKKYPGLELVEEKDRWHVLIPEKNRLDHEAHFGQVMERFLGFLRDGRLPEWEVSNMIAKYELTTRALELADSAHKDEARRGGDNPPSPPFRKGGD
jgi:predicted dehydrogenase